MVSVIKICFLLLLLYYTFCNVQILKYDEPGTYLLTPLEYSYSENIIVQIWGGGSGGSTVCSESKYRYKGGSSGSYVAANIITNNKTFTLTVGIGGLSCNSGPDPYKYYYCQGYPGSNSIIEEDNIFISTNNFIKYEDYDENNKIILNDTYGYIMDYFNGTKGDIIITDTLTNNAVKGVVAYNSNKYGPGAGADCCFVSANKGNDGAILIHFNSFRSPTITATRSSSITPSKTPSITVSRSLSPSVSPSTMTFFGVIERDLRGNKENQLLLIIAILSLIIVCCEIIVMLYRKYRIKNHFKLTFNTDGECCICLDGTKVIKCNYDHGICEQCYNQLDLRFKSDCPICNNAYLTIK